MNKLIDKYLKKNNITQKDLAEKIYVTPQAVSKWIKGISQPTFDNVVRMADIFGQKFYSQSYKKLNGGKKNMIANDKNLQNLETIEKAKEETDKLLEEINICNYPHSVNVLLSWFVPAVIGLTYHKYINNVDENEGYTYDDIFFYLNNYFEECYEKFDDFKNQLDYDFYLMGGDLMESFDRYKLKNHEFGNQAMDLWYRFKKVFDNLGSTLKDEFSVALACLIENNSDY